MVRRAEVVVQDAFLKLAGQRALPDNPAAWLFRVVRNGAIDAGQAARRRKRYETAASSHPTWDKIPILSFYQNIE